MDKNGSGLLDRAEIGGLILNLGIFLSDNEVQREREFFIDNLLVRIHRCFWWTVLAPWEFEFPFPGSLTSTFLGS